MHSRHSQPGLTVLRRPQVESRTGLSRSSLYALIASGQFPAPIRLTANTVGWLENDIERWIAQRAISSGVKGL